ncbi:MAG TPA: metalloregulator ArsR/SmtB family transcription factor [Thermoanaerobaculia bacterium]|jgi:DNA-binding transcriptional ArsR family regulator
MTTSPENPDVFHAIADPTRRRLLDLLRDAERPVTDLLESFRMTQSAVSQHLRVLRDAGLVRVRRLGRERLYRVDRGAVRPLADWTARLARRPPR